jgi:NAD(P)-dependent dehydrogenase (short-subunit alcohol dehydrogenase family)
MPTEQQADEPQHRVVLITGASSGIGRSAARAFARQGSSLVLASRSRAALEAVEQECWADGGTPLVMPTDVTDADQVDALFETAVTRFGRVDAVVHSATVLAYGKLEDVPREVFDRVIAVNVSGTANVARAALDCFQRQGNGRLVLVGSVLGKTALPLMSPYVVGKWAIHGLAAVLQLEEREGIDISLVWPGSVNTPVYLQAATFAGRVGRPIPPIDPPEKVARRIVRAVERPSRSVSVGIANRVIVLAFRVVPALYAVVMSRLMRWFGQSRERIGPQPGNVFEARPAGEAEHGHWGRAGGWKIPRRGTPPS